MISGSRKTTNHPKRISPSKDLSSGLRSPGLLARRPIRGIVMFILGGLIFGALFYNLRSQGPLLAWDKALANTLPAVGLASPPFIQYIMDAGFYLGKEVIMAVDGLLMVYFLLKRFWPELVMLTVGWAGGALLFHFLSTFIDRPRPPTQIWIVVNLPGFPSGHAIEVVICYGWLAYLLVAKMPSRFWKGAVIFLALLVITFVGFSRVFTAGHYLTDVLAGYAVGLAWSGLAYTVIELIFSGKRAQASKKLSPSVSS